MSDAAFKMEFDELQSGVEFTPKFGEIQLGKDGVTPTIGENGNWYLGDTDTGKPSQGADGKTPELSIGTVETLEAGSNATASIGGTPENPLLNIGIPKGEDGTNGKSAYQYAQDGGYTGTEEEFAAKLAKEIPDAYVLPKADVNTLGGVRASDWDEEVDQCSVNISPAGYLFTQNNIPNCKMDMAYKHVGGGGCVAYEAGESGIDLAYPALVLFGKNSRAWFEMVVYAKDGSIYTGSCNGSSGEMRLEESVPEKHFLTVTIDDDNKASHTPAEIYEAFQSGQMVLLLFQDILFNLAAAQESYAIFSVSFNFGDGTFVDLTVEIDENGNADMYTFDNAEPHPMPSMLLQSSTEGSNKLFAITVNDDGVISATELQG
ncbi:MAG: hypothetical protein ACI4PM_00690 [Butyricicoccus sp.]